MIRRLIAILISSALVLGNVSTSGWSANAASIESVTTNTTVNNQSPLPPGGAAGVKQAQGSDFPPWAAIAFVSLLVVFTFLLLDEDEDDGTSSPST